MNLFQEKSRIVITCSNRISPWLLHEIQQLGYQPVRIFKTGVEFAGTMQDCIRLNINLRCASQVLFSIRSFGARNADELYGFLKTLPWETIIPPNEYFSVTSNVQNETITNNLFANVKVKDAIVDRLRDKTGSRPDSGPDHSHAVIHLFWRDNEAEIFLDTSGETLSKHGYRKIPGKAPMMESLAAATIYASGWKKNTPFVNPMCGSGTLAVEAAMISTNRVPGLYRNNYSFMHAGGYKEEEYQSIFKEAEKKVLSITPKIIASDINEDAVNISKINAGIAGVEEMIEFSVCDFEVTPVPDSESGGAVFFNPEYGDRLGDESTLQATYKRMGDFLKQKCKGYFGYIFTGNPDLAKKIGLKPKRRLEFFNGKIDCRLLEFELYAGSKHEKNQVIPKDN